MLIKYLDCNVNVSELSYGSTAKVLVKCDDCGYEWITEHRCIIGKEKNYCYKNNCYAKHRISKTLKHRLALSLSHKGKHHTLESKLKISKHSFGRVHTQETKIKISNNHKGVVFTDSHKLAISRSLSNRIPWNKGKCHSIETKNKISISTIKYISKTEFNGGPMYPRIGKNEIPIIDQLSILTNIEFIKNNYNLALQIGKFPDAYSSKYNLVIEVLEKHHFKSNGELSDYDRERESIISWKLGCMIYYINEQEFLKNTNKEIQRFKDFIALLDEETVIYQNK